MKQSDALQWEESGSLPRPGWIGRSMRLALGAWCLYALIEVLVHWQVVLARPPAALQDLVVPVVVMLWLFNYVVNIGFGVSWRRFPLGALMVVFAISSVGSRILTGNWLDQASGLVLLLSLVYFYAHLGLSFCLAGLFATPGCEMRALPHLWADIARKHSDEHHCPAGFLHALDQWEAGRRGG